MRISIDNLDGAGAVDYTNSVAKAGRIRVERRLNAPSRCVATVVEGVDGRPLPVRRARVVVCAEDIAATVLFTGYLATEPVRRYSGEASIGAVYEARITAISDEWLLDRAGSGVVRKEGISLALDSRTLLQRLTNRVPGGAGISVAGDSGGRTAGVVFARTSASWSANAGEAAGAAYASYRALNGQVMLQPAASVTHTLSDANGTLDVKSLQVGAVRELANDVTVSGAQEPAALVSEIFIGDGTTTSFALGETPFRGAAGSLIDDSFERSAIDTTVWSVGDPGSHFSLTSDGLTFSGGTGLDGQTVLEGLDALEMGGSLVVELGSVQLGAGSDGMLGGVYMGTLTLPECFAGFRVRQSTSGTGGVTLLVPVLNGAEVGTSFTPLAGHRYTLRLRLHSSEMYRVKQRYYVMADGVVENFGDASGIDSPMSVVFELIDQGASSNTPATVLFDSAAGTDVPVTPATCAVVAVNSTHLVGSVGRVRVRQAGSVWVTSTPVSGVAQTRLIGVAGEGVDCVVQYGSTPKITFFDGRVPAANEQILVRYRRTQRSVARMADAASLAAEAAGGTSGTCRWLGKVLQPVARTSVDCESAAQALLAIATSRTAAVSGTYAASTPEDIWPGDVLSITSEGVTSSLLVRSVLVDDGGCAPEWRTYRIAFANDWATEWADGLGLRLSEAIAEDADIPETAALGTSSAIADLPGLRITALTSTTLSLDTGSAAPAGGGFEVRRRDVGFGPGSDADLVLRSPVQNISIPRAAQVERYFVRAYDAATPARYSRFSSAVFVNAPVA